MNGYQPDVSAPSAQAAEADGTATDRIVGLAFGKYVVTARESQAPGGETEPIAARDADPSPQAQDVLRVTLNQIAEHDAIAAQAERGFAEYWGATGPDYEAQADQDGGAWPEEPWWDGEKLHGAEAAPREAEPEGEAEAGI
jgi:hypothetical protein